MTTYLYVYVLIACLLPFDKFRLKPAAVNACLTIPFFSLLILAGTRLETGNDWLPYFDYFQELVSVNDKANDFEFGYRLFSYTIKVLGISNSGFVFVSTAVYLIAFFLVFRRQKAPIAIALLFYCTYLLGWMGTSRQVIAIGLTVCAGQCLIDKRVVAYFALVLLAASFHQTAIIFLLAWFLNRPLNKISMNYAMIILSVIGGQLLKLVFPLIIDKFTGIEGLGEKVVFYGNLGTENLNHASSAILGWLWYLKRLAFLFLFIQLREKFNDQPLSFYFNAYVFSVSIFLFIAPSFPILATRGSNYFSIYELFLLASLISTKGRWSILALPFIILISGQRLYTSLYAYHPDLYVPYKGLFINNDYTRSLY